MELVRLDEQELKAYRGGDILLETNEGGRRIVHKGKVIHLHPSGNAFVVRFELRQWTRDSLDQARSGGAFWEDSRGATSSLLSDRMFINDHGELEFQPSTKGTSAVITRA